MYPFSTNGKKAALIKLGMNTGAVPYVHRKAFDREDNHQAKQNFDNQWKEFDSSPSFTGQESPMTLPKEASDGVYAQGAVDGNAGHPQRDLLQRSSIDSAFSSNENMDTSFGPEPASSNPQGGEKLSSWFGFGKSNELTPQELEEVYEGNNWHHDPLNLPMMENMKMLRNPRDLLGLSAARNHPAYPQELRSAPLPQVLEHYYGQQKTAGNPFAGAGMLGIKDLMPPSLKPANPFKAPSGGKTLSTGIKMNNPVKGPEMPMQNATTGMPAGNNAQQAVQQQANTMVQQTAMTNPQQKLMGSPF